MFTPDFFIVFTKLSRIILISVFSFDLRNRIHGTTKPKSTPGAFGTRVHFNTATVPAQLLVDNLKMSDEGVYRCRVDFRNTPTRNAKVNLTIIGKLFPMFSLYRV
ncbi:hypothetical protein WDU94_012860 [Cyamophila willieti]